MTGLMIEASLNLKTKMRNRGANCSNSIGLARPGQFQWKFGIFGQPEIGQMAERNSGTKKALELNRK